MKDNEFEISLNRKTLSLWTIPSEFKRRHKICDGQKLRFEIHLNNITLGQQSFTITSGEEIYLPTEYQQKLKDKKGIVKFILKTAY